MMDAQLLSDFLSHRDELAFETLVARHGPMVLRVCRDVLGDPYDAEDAFQATFLVLVRRAGAIRDRASLGPWLYEVAWRISRRARGLAAKRRAQQRQVLAMDIDAASSIPPSDPTRNEMKPILHDEIQHLPAKFREPIILCYLEGLTVEVAARRIQCPVGTLKSRLCRGRELLRSRLTRRGLTVSAVLLLLFAFSEDASASLAMDEGWAVVPDELLESTVKVGMHAAEGRISSSTIPRQVAAMARQELASRRQVRAVASVLVLTTLASLGSMWVSLTGQARTVPLFGPTRPGAASVAAKPERGLTARLGALVLPAAPESSCH
jgi:RNA polymerase sigma factor (sigma-70 family)